MRRFWTSIVLVLALTGSAVGQSREITDVISRQIQAFKIDDFDTAFTFASPNIRRIFRTPENFGRMVSQGYPMVWRPADVEYLGLREENGRFAQTVRITDLEGRAHLLEYFMIATDDGWKINGVQFLKDMGSTA